MSCGSHVMRPAKVFMLEPVDSGFPLDGRFTSGHLQPRSFYRCLRATSCRYAKVHGNG